MRRIVKERAAAPGGEEPEICKACDGAITGKTGFAVAVNPANIRTGICNCGASGDVAGVIMGSSEQDVGAWSPEWS
jgi:hypothetical protein